MVFSNCLHYEKEAAYGLKDFNGVVGTAVERNTEYVLDYKRLIDPVSYTVSFIDSQTKEQIATHRSSMEMPKKPLWSLR